MSAKPIKIEYVETSKIKLYEHNPRYNDQAVDAVAASIREFGWRQPIVLDADYVVVVGDTRYKAALKIGETQCPCIFADDLTPEQIKAYRLADNKTGELAGWNFGLLDIEMAGLDMDLGEFGFKPKFDVRINQESATAGQYHVTGDADRPRYVNDAALQGEVVTDPLNEWRGMPEFEQKDADGIQRIVVHFKTREAVKRFAELVGQNITDRTKAIWFPYEQPLSRTEKVYEPDL